MKMMEPSRKNRILLVATRRIVLKLFLVAALIGASAAISQADVYWWGEENGWTSWLHCGTSAGNYWSFAPPCPPGESCLHDICDTQACQETATNECRKRGYISD